MKNTLLISIASAVVVGAIAVTLLMRNSDSDVKTSQNDQISNIEEQNQEVEKTPISGTETMIALLEKGEDLECSVSYISEENSNSPTTGTFFTSQGKMRGDFVVMSMQEEIVSSMIMDTESMYTWTIVNGDKYGMKISQAELENSKKNDDSPEAHEAVPVDVAVDYECKPWKEVDRSIFVPPTDVIFKDYSDLMNTGMEFGNVYGEEGVSLEGKSPCQLCEQVEGAGKEECKKAFSCQ